MLLDTQTEQTRFEDWIAVPTRVEQLLAKFATTSLEKIGKAALLDRVETKYIISAKTLPIFLNTLHNDYNVLSVKGRRLNRYRTLYFDSADFDLYHRHHAGATNRYKVRSRQYTETGKSFLEIKHKDNKRKTHKQRFVTDQFMRVIDPKSGDFLRHRYPHNVDLLYGRLLTNYSRITLVSRHHAERVTIDLGLSFEWEGKHKALPHIAIIEVKREPNLAGSHAITSLRQWHIRPQRFSKYCMGVVHLYPHVKHNNFKPQLRLIHKLSQGTSYAYQQ